MHNLTYEEYRRLWDLVARKPFLTAFPIHLDVELTSRCNLRCEMCYQQYIRAKRTDMAETLFRKIVDEGVQEGLCAMKLQSRGESLLHPRVLDLLGYAKDSGILDVHITTNGLLLTEPMIAGLVENHLDLLILSFDAAHAKAARMRDEEYTRFMQDVVKKIDGRRRKAGSGRPRIRIQTCTPDYTPAAIAGEEKRSRELFPEADLVLINPVYASHEETPHLADLASFRFHPCSYLWQRLTLYADGSVTTCSRDYNCKFNRLGDANVSSIRDLWHSPLLRDLRRKHLAGRRREFHICELCENYLIHRETGLPGAGCTGTVYDIQEERT